MSQIPNWRLLASGGFMILNYAILVGYDWLALIAIGKPLPIRRTALVSFIGQAVSYNFGALLGGTTARYRFYSAWGFSLEEIVRLVLMLAVTFWVGALGLCGAVFLIAPPVIPFELLEKMPVKDVRILGGFLLCLALSYLVLCFFIRKPVRAFGKEFVFPSPKIALLQAVVAGVDLLAAAACMYVLLPGELEISFMQFLPSYLMAQVAVVLTHVPGGVGVFELVILHLTQTPREHLVVAAVLCFRVVYFILPLLAAAVLLAAYEAQERRKSLRDAGRWLSVLSHSISAWATFSAGIILLAFSVLPTPGDVRALLTSYVPIQATAAGHWFGAFSGAALLFLAYGLEARQAAAWRLSVFFLSLGFVCTLLKGLHWLPAGMLLLVILAVVMAKRRFYRRSSFWETSIPLRWLWPSWLVLSSATGFAWMLYHRHLARASLWDVDHRAYNAGSNLRAVIGVSAALLLIWAWRVWRRAQTRGGKDVRDIDNKNDLTDF